MPLHVVALQSSTTSLLCAYSACSLQQMVQLVRVQMTLSCQGVAVRSSMAFIERLQARPMGNPQNLVKRLSTLVLAS